MPKIKTNPIIIGGEQFFSVPAAADRLQMNRVTLCRWSSRGAAPSGTRLRVMRDTTNGHFYISATSIDELNRQYGPESRFVPVSTGEPLLTRSPPAPSPPSAPAPPAGHTAP